MRIDWDQLILNLVGTDDLTLFITVSLFALVGAFLSGIFKVSDEDVAKCPDSPEIFSLTYFLKDHW